MAMKLAKPLLLFPRRSGTRAQFSKALEQQEREPVELHGFATFVVEQAAEPLSVQCIALHFGMSTRSLARMPGAYRERFAVAAAG
jgi:transcriptional regulator GlxA family with amidase domain